MKTKEIIEIEKIIGKTLTKVETSTQLVLRRNSNSFLLNDERELLGLNLCDNQITDISFLQGLTNLKYLDLSSNQITDISFLEGLINLQELGLESNQITDISFLQGLINLQELYLWGNKIIDISFLQGLINLQKLYLSSNQITDISFLQGLTNLQHLELGSNQIDISFLQDLVNLQKLTLSRNQITDISFLQGLKNLQELDCSQNQITDISFLQGLTNLQVLNLAYNQITDISFLQGLNHLQELNCSRNQIRYISLDFLSYFPKLEKLFIFSNPIQNIPRHILADNINAYQPFWNLSKKIPVLNLEKQLDFSLAITEFEDDILDKRKNKSYLLNENNEVVGLNLYDCALYDISFLQELTNVTNLNLGENNIYDASILQGLTHLTSLSLRDNHLSDISFLQRLTDLTSLDLSGNQITDISFLKDLTKLTHLDLQDNQITNTSFLKGLTNLTSLSLSNNQITDISFLREISNLTNLRLGGNQIRDVSILEGLTHLTKLTLNNNQICDISFLQYLTNLTSLGLSNNQISDISFLQTLINLTNLELKFNEIRYISFLENLTNLITLDLSDNQISFFPLAVLNHFPVLEELYGHGNPIQNIPKEIFDRGYGFLENVRNYLFAQAEGVILHSEAKIIWLGNGEAGKTTLSHQLRKKEFSEEIGKDRTHGIMIKEWNIPYEELSQSLQDKISRTIEEVKQEHPEREIAIPDYIKLNLWDFGGQEYYHATHRLFLSSNVLYLLVWDEETNQQDETKGIYPLAYWRESIENYTTQNIVLEIQNKENGRSNPNAAQLQYKVAFRDETQPRSMQKYEFDIADLTDAIHQQLSNLPYLGSTFPKVYDDIRQAIRIESQPYIVFSEYTALCQAHDFTAGKIMQDPSQIQTLTELLHDTGTIICYHYKNFAPSAKAEKLQGYVFLKPEWVTSYIYQILSEDLHEKGEFDLLHIQAKTQDSGISPDVWISLMKEFELIFEKKDTANVFVIPQYLPKNCSDLSPKAFGKLQKELCHEFTLYYPTFLAKSVISRFISQYGNLAEDYYWKYGIVIHQDDKKALIVADYHPLTYKSISVKSNNRTFCTQLFQRIVELSHSQANIELYVPTKKSYKELSEIKEYRNEYKEEFWFLFEEVEQNTGTHKHTINTSQSMTHKKHLHSLISEGKLEQAIKELLAATEQNGQKELHSSIIGQSGSFHRIEREKLETRISNDNYNLTWSNIKHALLHYIEAEYKDNGQFIWEEETERSETDINDSPVNKAAKVFISYNHGNKDVALEIIKRLEQSNILVTIDRENLKVGKDIKAFIEKSIEENDYILSLVSKNSLESAWVAMETVNSFYAQKYTNKQFIAAFIEGSFFEDSFVNDTLDKIDEKIASISNEIKRSLEKNRNIKHLQDDLERYKDLNHHLPSIVQHLKNTLSVDISGDSFEEGINRILKSISVSLH